MAVSVINEGEEGSDLITISNVDAALYPTESISTDPFAKLEEVHNWKNYFRCGYKAILAHSQELREAMKDKTPVGMKILIDSNVPPESGLSSSSAFTVCAAIATMHANGLTDKVP